MAPIESSYATSYLVPFRSYRSLLFKFWTLCVFEPGGITATYDDHLWLIGKHVVDFLLVSIELFSLGVIYTAEALRAKMDRKSAISLQRGQLDPKFQVEGVAPTNHSLSQKRRLHDLLYGIKIWTDSSSVLAQSTRLTDRQTDGQTPFSRLDRTAFNAAR